MEKYDRRYKKLVKWISGKYKLYKILKLIQENPSRLFTQDLVTMISIYLKALFLGVFINFGFFAL